MVHLECSDYSQSGKLELESSTDSSQYLSSMTQTMGMSHQLFSNPVGLKHIVFQVSRMKHLGDVAIISHDEQSPKTYFPKPQAHSSALAGSLYPTGQKLRVMIYFGISEF